MRLLSVLLGLGVSALQSATAKYTCDTSSPGDFYPYCVNVPDVMPEINCAGRIPFILYLPGSGADVDDPSLEELTASPSLDGVGKLLANYRKGNTSSVVKFAAENFITVIPVSPKTNPNNASQDMKHYWPEKVAQVLKKVALDYPQVDMKRFYTVGYSKGSRGTWRFNTAYPKRAAAAINDAGGAESTGDQFMIPQTGFDDYPATFPLLYRLKNLPIRQFDGSIDDTAGVVIPRKTQKELVRIGNTQSTLAECKADHEGMQTAPWTIDHFEWLLKHSKRKEGTCVPLPGAGAPIPSARHRKARRTGSCWA